MGHSRDTVQSLLQLPRQCLGDSGTAWPPGEVCGPGAWAQALLA